MAELLKVGTVKDFETSNCRRVEFAGRAVVLIKLEDRFFAIDDECPHAGYSLHDGHLKGPTLTCLLHGAEFDVRTGRCVGGLACSDVETYPVVETEDGELFIRTE